MNDQQTGPRLPIVGEHVRGLGTLMEIRDVTPPPPPKAEQYVFQDTHAYAEGRLNGKVLATGPTFNSINGPGTDVEAAKEAARRQAAVIGPSDEIAFVVVQETFQSPVAAARLGAHFYDKTYRLLERPNRPCSVPDPCTKDVWEYRLTREGPVEKDLMEDAQDNPAKVILALKL